MNVDRFVTLELRVHKEQPTVADLEALLKDWGLPDASQERLWVISYDGIEQIRTVQELVIGGYHGVDIPLPPLLTAVLMAGADRFQIAHNHPSGDTTPTIHDVDMTHKVMNAANAAGLYFEDSLIVGPTQRPFSFTANGLILPPSGITAMAADSGHQRAIITRT